MDQLTASSVDTVELDSVIITPELHNRPSRPPDYEAENGALVALARELATSPDNILQKLAGSLPFPSAARKLVGSVGLNPAVRTPVAPPLVAGGPLMGGGKPRGISA